MSRKEQAKPEQEQAKCCVCPYCEQEIEADMLPFCQPCGVTLRYCPRCEIVVEWDASVCPRCGQPVE